MTDIDTDVATMKANIDELQRKTAHIPEECVKTASNVEHIKHKVDELLESQKFTKNTIIVTIITVTVQFILTFLPKMLQ